MAQLEQILTSLAELNPADLAKVKLAASHLSGSKAETPKNTSAAVETVWDLIVEVLAERGNRLPPLSVVSRHRLYPKIVEGCEHLYAYAKHFNPRNSLELRGALRVCVEALLMFVQEKTQGAPFSIRVLAYQLPNIGSAVESQFPHYREAGLLPILIRGNKPSSR